MDKEYTPVRINPFNEIKISMKTNVREAIDFVLELLLRKRYKTIILAGLSLAIKKVVLIAEIIKVKIAGLHQVNKIDCINGEYDEEKMVPRMEIKLTFIEPSDKDKGLGYQSPNSNIMLNSVNTTDNNERIKIRKNINIGYRRYIRINRLDKYDNQISVQAINKK